MRNLIYQRASERGIKIESAPKHRHNRDYIGAGRRNVAFPNSNRIYSYTGTLTDIALRLGLITEQELEAYYLTFPENMRCSKCGQVGSKLYIDQFGHCANCPTEEIK